MADELKSKVMTTDAGRPVGDNQNSLTVGPRGPIVFDDFLLFEKMAHFNRERIPERVVHAKGSGAHGTFTCTNPDMKKYTKAKLFDTVGKKTPTFIRFSTVGGEKGSADSERDPRGFALKFYTEEGNWDMVGNNTPVFFIRDPLKFGDFIHTQKRDPETNLKSPRMMWDFWSLSPESLHQVTILFSAIEKGDFPKWAVKIQVMPEAESKTYHINPFDLTKVWPHGDYPLIEIGELELNRNPANYFAEVEQAAFEPRNIVPGMGFSPDRMLQGRLISYPDAHRYRLGVNYDKLPVNSPKCPFATYNRDGAMAFTDNGGASPNYEPNSFGGPTQDPRYKERPTTYDSATVERYDHRELDGDYYTQPGNLFRLMKPDAQARLCGNIAAGLGQVETRIQDLQINHFYKCDPKYGEGVAKALGRKIEEIVKKEELVTA